MLKTMQLVHEFGRMDSVQRLPDALINWTTGKFLDGLSDHERQAETTKRCPIMFKVGWPLYVELYEWWRHGDRETESVGIVTTRPDASECMMLTYRHIGSYNRQFATISSHMMLKIMLANRWKV